MNPEQKQRKLWWSWKRVGVIAVTLIALVFIAKRVDGAALGTAFRQMSPGWFLIGLIVYGFAFLIAGWRWHLVLRLTGCSVNLTATTRLCFIGHYLFVVLFGGVPGDIAKCSIYARWYGWTFAEVFATSPLDRLLGLVGLTLFGGAAFGLAAVNGGMGTLGGVQMNWPGWWVLLVVLIAGAGVAGLFVLKPQGEHPMTKLFYAIREGGGRLLKSPGLAGQGVFCAFVVQLCLSSVMGLCLMAVTQNELPWAQLLWTFPVISMVSSLPVTFAGLGVREGAAIVLLGAYGVPESEAVAAALLSFSVNILWAMVGGVLLWREEGLLRRNANRKTPRTLSVVIPVLNEAKSLTRTMEDVRKVPEVTEVIVVDGGSTDRTRELAEELGCKVLHSEPGRGIQMRAGAKVATGDVVVMLHADTWLPPESGQAVLTALRDRQAVGGGFWKVFREPTLLLLGSRYKCAIRLYLGRRIAGDQALFVRREVLEAVGGVPAMVLMEEFKLCSELRKVGRLELADATIQTSARRFREGGVFRTYMRMWYVTTRYRLGSSGSELRRIYERE